ncbi:MAG: hypothetical protein AAGH82_09150, partial [Pseudomonadota bacterium]
QQTQSNFDISASDRRSMIDDLAAGLADRSADIERQMNAFSELVNTTLSDAENRARDIGTILARTSDSATQNLSAQLASLSNAADEESRRAAGVIKAASQGMAAEMTDAIESATQRFTQASEDMRKAASTVQTELNETRGELRKGVLELPEEARENTAALRRAVGDQLKALKDLSNIVTDTKDAYGASEIARPVAPAPAARPASAPAPASAAREMVDQAVAEQMPDPQSRETFDRDTPAPQQTPAAEPTSKAAGRADVGSGTWVKDLLARASKEEPKEPEQPLGAITSDIASAMDHRAVDDLWTRYRRGERGLFSRSLYTVNGQNVFDQISSKYISDLSFRSHVDRYIQDFERALADIARNDRDGRQTQGTLTSSNGKVYTMLAHASGRLN